MAMSSQDRLARFTDLTQSQLSGLPGKITRLHDKWSKGINVPSRGFVIFPAVVEDILPHINGELPKEVREELLVAYADADFERLSIKAAVRGALSIEDQADASWAGGSESPTNILGADSFIEAVLCCVRETFSGKMDGYKDRLGIEDDFTLSILVHEMAVCDRFALVFTRNPMNGLVDEVVVQSTFGGGQLLTGGQETGDIFVLSRDGSILSRSVTTKNLMVQDEGPVAMPVELRNQASLSDDQLLDLMDFSLKVEALEGGVPQDFEIALGVNGSGGLVKTLIQNRPVTALDESIGLVRYAAIKRIKSACKEEAARLKNSCGVDVGIDCLSDQNIAELLTRRPKPFSFGLFTYIFAHGAAGIKSGRLMMGYDIGTELDSGFFELVGSQPRCSIVHDALTYRIKGIPLVDYVEGFVKFYLDKISQDENLANYPEVVLYDQNPSLDFLSTLYGPEKALLYMSAYNAFFLGIRQLEESFADNYRRELEPIIESFVGKHESLDCLALSPESLQSLQEKLDFLRTDVCKWFVVVARLGFFAYARLRKTLESHFAPEEAKSLLDKLTSGLENDPTTEFNSWLFHFAKGEISRDDVLRRFGHLGFNELEIAGLRYHEQPEVIDTLAARISSDPKASDKQSETEATLRELKEVLSGDVFDELSKDVHSAKKYLVLREQVKFQYLKIYDLIRRQLVGIEKSLDWSSGLIFFLDPREISLLFDDCDAAKKLALQRQSVYISEEDLEVPQVIFTDNLSTIGLADIPVGANELKGIGVTSFVLEGKAVVVNDPNDQAALEQLENGCILVAYNTDPAWTPVMGAVGHGGLITEVGGPLAHGAITARELGLAAVLNVKHATKLIKTGQRVRVDGPAGRVYIYN